jgi:hypothetical protein
VAELKEEGLPIMQTHLGFFGDYERIASKKYAVGVFSTST